VIPFYYSLLGLWEQGEIFLMAFHTCVVVPAQAKQKKERESIFYVSFEKRINIA